MTRYEFEDVRARARSRYLKDGGTLQRLASMDAHAARIAAHYDHARAKHRGFADILFIGEEKQTFAKDAESRLDIWRMIAGFEKTDAESVLMCEFAEARHAYAQGDKAAAVEELYDTVAVLLRMVDVLEGRQPLGKPAKEAK